ncbi:MAG: 3-isopropylmalate dehydratase large subunit [Burkholderiaceae bacterium]|nr:3-isopropylmalate dehydratase large subunit [Burkholderiaceae bacterium]MCD8517051.1 3-isopropylmalate dehydratase large subunit [Burkholderiaceae bacterium]MCD8536901.1 3-isopropylmalate dehydratase large subunit [Burkholderiaceae bacterium]MCD8566072.1 3-isopropylmalate dehydratase large subunit [Burkholderiaceae bacterium]
MGKTLYDKLWDSHVVDRRSDGSDLLYVDRHYVHDACFQGFDFLHEAGLPVRRADLTFGMEDHYIATRPASVQSERVMQLGGVLQSNAKRHGFTSFGRGTDYQGIVHVVGPELGLSLPGALVVCGDSHTATHGALGCLAFGVGASEIAHVLGTQAIWQQKSKSMRIKIDGKLSDGVVAKDIILFLIGLVGAQGGTGHVIEYAGSTIADLSVEARMTICNMSIEAGAKAGIVAPDESVFEYLRGRRYAPGAEAFETAVVQWRLLKSDTDAIFSHEIDVQAESLEPTVTWGTSPETSLGVTAKVPELNGLDVSLQAKYRPMMQYMGLEPGTRLQDLSVDQVFIGSCTNSRIEDLRLAASIARKGKAKVPALVVPGSVQVQQQAQAEGLDRIFIEAGFEWAKPGCSMCVAMNGDSVALGKRCLSTSNRNFMGRQGQGSRTHLASPLTAAASALTGRITDAREWL